MSTVRKLREQIMIFEYRARDRRGKLCGGTWTAPHKSVVVEGLLKQDLCIVSLRETRVQQDNSLGSQLGKLAGVGNPDLIMMTRQLSVMLAAGLPIIRSLKVLALQTSNQKLKEVLLFISNDVESGLALGEALAKYPKIFSRVYVSLIKAGEMGGALAAVLERLCDYLEKEEQFKSSLKSASIYPVITTVMAVFTVFFVVAFVMPKFAGLFQSSGVALPWPTQLLLGVSTLLQRGAPFIIVGMGLSLYIVKRAQGSLSGRLFFDNLLLRVPILGRIVKQVVVARFASTLGVLIKTGIPILPALEVAGKTAGNSAVREAVTIAGHNIKEGGSIAAQLQSNGIFEPLAINMIAVGEETVALDEMLLQLSNYYEVQLQHTLAALISLLEPLLIVVVALLVGGVVIAMLLPMLEMVNLVGM